MIRQFILLLLGLSFLSQPAKSQGVQGDTIKYGPPYSFSIVSPSDWWLNVTFDSSYIQNMAPQPPALLISTSSLDAKMIQSDGFTKAMQAKYLKDATKKGFKFVKLEHKALNGIPVTIATYSFLDYMDEEILQLDYMVPKYCGEGRKALVFTILIPKSRMQEMQPQLSLVEQTLKVGR